MAWIFAALLVLSARGQPALPGIVICFGGATIRFWASGYLRKDTRPAVGGPYGYVRNPLYLGTYLMAVGTAAATESWWLLSLVSVAFALIYHYIILDEEQKLEKIFGEPYRLYLKTVPRFFPWPKYWFSRKFGEHRSSPPSNPLYGINADSQQHRFSWELANKNKAYEAYASFAGLIGLVWAIALLWERFGN